MTCAPPSGDVIAVERQVPTTLHAGTAPCQTAVVAVLEISSPRRPCSRVDQRFGRTFSLDGVRAAAARTGSAGIMMRVLQPGTLAKGDCMRVTQRPHPEWSVARAAQLLYGHPAACMMYASRDVKISEWMGTMEELQQVQPQCSHCPSLAPPSPLTPSSAARVTTAC